MKITSKQKRVDEISELLLDGWERIKIVQLYSKKYKITYRQVDKYIKEAKEIASKKQQNNIELINNLRSEEIQKAVKNDIISDLEIEAKLCKIIKGELEIDDWFSTKDGPISIKRKPNHSDITKAADLLFKKRGSYATEKLEIMNITPPQINVIAKRN